MPATAFLGRSPRGFAPKGNSSAQSDGEMKGRRKRSGRQSVHDAVSSDEIELALGAEQIGQTERPAKVLKFVQQPRLTCWQLSIWVPVALSTNELARPPKRGRDSKTVTPTPRSADATAAARPANPPPTITVRGPRGGIVVKPGLPQLVRRSSAGPERRD